MKTSLFLSAFAAILTPLAESFDEVKPGTVLPTCPSGLSGSGYFTGATCQLHKKGAPPPLAKLKKKCLAMAKSSASNKYNCPAKCTEGRAPDVQPIEGSFCKKDSTTRHEDPAECDVPGLGCCFDRNDGNCPSYPEDPSVKEHCMSCAILVHWSIKCNCEED